MRDRIAFSLGALALVGIVSYGSRGSLGLFIKPWEEAFDASRGSVSLISSLGFVFLGLGQPVAGRLLESFEARRILVAGLALSSGGFLGAAFASELWQAIVLIGVVSAFGGGLTAVSSLTYIAAELVERRRGLIFGILTAGTAGGQVVVLPIATAALGVSLRAALVTVGVVLAAVAAAAIALVPSVQPVRAVRPPGRLLGLARTPAFWFLLVPFFVCGYTTTGLIDTHLIPHAVDHHISEATASGALTALAAFNMAGVLIAGAATDRVDRGRLLALVYAARAGSLVLLPFLTTPTGIFVFAVLFGLADFATVPPTTSLTRTLFRDGGWALALGLISASHQVGSALGAFLGGWLYDVAGTYAWSFASAAVALVVASALSYALRDPARLTPQPSQA